MQEIKLIGSLPKAGNGARLLSASPLTPRPPTRLPHDSSSQLPLQTIAPFLASLP
jgi:hypothetical protein